MRQKLQLAMFLVMSATTAYAESGGWTFEIQGTTSVVASVFEGEQLPPVSYAKDSAKIALPWGITSQVLIGPLKRPFSATVTEKRGTISIRVLKYNDVSLPDGSFARFFIEEGLGYLEYGDHFSKTKKPTSEWNEKPLVPGE